MDMTPRKMSQQFISVRMKTEKQTWMPDLKTCDSQEWPSHDKRLSNDIARTAPLAFDITMMKLFLMTTSQENKLYSEQQTCRTSHMRHSYIESKRGSPNSMCHDMKRNREEQATIYVSKNGYKRDISGIVAAVSFFQLLQRFVQQLYRFCQLLYGELQLLQRFLNCCIGIFNF